MHDAAAPGSALLRPLSHKDQRLWRVGEKPHCIDLDLVLDTRPDDLASFSSLRSIAAQMRGFRCCYEEAAEIERLLTAPELAGEWATSARFGADAVVLSVMRRISRESVHTAHVIDRGAQLLNRAAARLAVATKATRFWLPDLDRLDRPSLKVVARAALLLEPQVPVTWCWHSSRDPREPARAEDLYSKSRRDLLLQLAGLIAPHFEGQQSGGLSARPAMRNADLQQLAEALVLQNYDAVFAGAPALGDSSADREESAEAFRLEGIAAVNVGKFDEAESCLTRAEGLAPSRARRAHIAYLRGLTSAKRRYRLGEARDHYARGLRWLDGADPAGHDLALERAWLLNGVAFDHAIRSRLETDSNHLEAAFSLVKEAFDLVRDGRDASRGYLRFNLIANTALLLEMNGRHLEAAEVFRRAFEGDVATDAARQRRFEATLGYRMGLLFSNGGRPAEGLPLLRRAAEIEREAGSWATEERALRAVATVALALDLAEVAEDAYTRGLELARSGRSAAGTMYHAQGLAACRLRGGDRAGATALFTDLRVVEGLPLANREVPRSSADWRRLLPKGLSPKLPAYIPEIDLEEIPRVDMNRFLTRSEGSRPMARDLGATE